MQSSEHAMLSNRAKIIRSNYHVVVDAIVVPLVCHCWNLQLKLSNSTDVIIFSSFNEYGAAFNSRPRVLRTPEPGVRPISRGLAGDGPTPRPQMSDGLPTSRPNTGARSPGDNTLFPSIRSQMKKTCIGRH